MKFSKQIILAGASALSLMVASNALAQSTATEAVETVIVKGNRKVGDLRKEYGAKAKVVVDQQLISNGPSGQTIAETLNVVPGYNFSNTDAYGSSGGTMRIRGMDGSRISLTVDGVQLNDTGNYAIYTNQQLEPELICQASVNTGATDVDSMSASASGGTVNYSTCAPSEKMGGVAKLSFGDWGYSNQFVRLDTGKFGPFGTRAYFAYTNQDYDTWQLDAEGPASLKKKQYNALVYQDIGDKGSFISLAAHYNENRNRLIFSNTKATIASRGYNWNSAGLERVNPSDTGNIRIKSKWVINEKLTLTFDPTYQNVMANGGGGLNLDENDASLCGTKAGTAGCGIDFNKNGSITGRSASNPSYRIYAPSNTNTNRLSLTTSAIYKITDDHTLRAGASLDRGRHRQTGEGSYFSADGKTPQDVFSAKEEKSIAVLTNDGIVWQKRDRLSQANVDVYSLEYSGRFLEDALTLKLGVRYQKMERQLNQYCYSLSNGSGDVLCTKEPTDTSLDTTESDVKKVTFKSKGAAAVYISPFARTYTFEKTLPNLGLTYRFADKNQIFTSYSESMSSPRTDSYYNVKLVSNTLTPANPEIETSKSFELGYRYLGSKLYLTANVFQAFDKNRIVFTFDPETDKKTDRNVGDVNRQGIEAQVSYQALKNLGLTLGYTYTDAEVQDNLIVDLDSTGKQTFIPTKGKTLVDTPKEMFNLAVNYTFADKLHFNLTGKFVGNRFTTDMNDDMVDGFDVWNASMRYDLGWAKPGTYLQFNVTNLFNTQYYNEIKNSQNTAKGVLESDGTTWAGVAPDFNVAAPRTFVGSLRIAF